MTFKEGFLALERRLTGVAMLGAGVMLVLAASLGLFQILTRFVFEQPAEWSEVLIRFALIWMVFLGIPEAFRMGSMVSIDLFHRLAPRAVRRWLEALIALVTLSLLAVYVWYGWDYAQRGSVQSMAGLESISMFWAYIAIPIGSLFAAFGVIGNFLEPRHSELDTAQ